MSSKINNLDIPKNVKISHEIVKLLDEKDPLANQADKFKLPKDLIYLDGNSLGAMPKAVPSYVEDALLDGWATQLIRSWNNKGWHNLPFTLADRLAPIMGAKKGEVLLVDSTSLNLFKTLVAAIKMRATMMSLRQNPERRSFRCIAACCLSPSCAVHHTFSSIPLIRGLTYVCHSPSQLRASTLSLTLTPDSSSMSA